MELRQHHLTEKSLGVASRFFHFVSDCMAPLIPALLGGGMVRILVTLLGILGLLSPTSSTGAILAVIGNAFFYFLPIMLAASVAKRVGVDPMLAMLIGAILLHPDLTALLASGSPSFLWLPVLPVSYAASVFPIFITVIMMRYLDELAAKITPHCIATFFRPFLTVLLTAPLALTVIGPIGSFFGKFLASLIDLLHTHAHPLAVALTAAIMPFVKLTGMHHSLLPLAAVSLATLGYDPLINVALFASSLSLGGASLAIALLSKTKHTRQIAIGASLSATLAGVVEPALYGVTLRRNKTLAACCIASGVAGLFAGLGGAVVYASGVPPSLFTLINMLDESSLSNFKTGLFTLSIALILSFSLTLFFHREDTILETIAKGATMNEHTHEESTLPVFKTQEKIITLISPASGKVIALKDVKDESFAEGYLGDGCAILPSDGHIYAPIDGRIISLFDTHHAVTLLSHDGLEILIHVGRDTVTLGGRYFSAFCQNGDEVKAGDLLLSFDLDALEKEGFDLTTPIVITNNTMYTKIETTSEPTVTAADALITVHDDGKRAG